MCVYLNVFLELKEKQRRSSQKTFLSNDFIDNFDIFYQFVFYWGYCFFMENINILSKLWYLTTQVSSFKKP